MKKKSKPKTLLIVINVDWLFNLHRMPIAIAAQQNGFEVIVATKDTGHSEKIKAAGFKFIPINISRSGIDPFEEVKLLINFYKIYKNIKPTIVYHITMKPVIYGSLIARFLKIGTVNSISGLGYNFTAGRRGLVQKVMIQLMQLGFRNKNSSLIFENRDDFRELNHLKIVTDKTNVHFSNGIGVDLNFFKPSSREENSPLQIIFASRMLWDKGVKELIEAAKMLAAEYRGKVQFKLVGMVDKQNREGVPERYLKENEIPDFLMWMGYKEDMLSIFQQSSIAVLPSYREGRPTFLLEACAMGLPIVTTNAIGCKDCVDEGINGFKVPVKSVKELKDAIEKLIMDKNLRNMMGENGRKKAIKEFDQNEVVKLYTMVFNSFVKSS